LSTGKRTYKQDSSCGDKTTIWDSLESAEDTEIIVEVIGKAKKMQKREG
jgi:hypothetical protein